MTDKKKFLELLIERQKELQKRLDWLIGVNARREIVHFTKETLHTNVLLQEWLIAGGKKMSHRAQWIN